MKPKHGYSSVIWLSNEYVLFLIVTTIQARLPTFNYFGEAVTEEVYRQHPEPGLHKLLARAVES